MKKSWSNTRRYESREWGEERRVRVQGVCGVVERNLSILGRFGKFEVQYGNNYVISTCALTNFNWGFKESRNGAKTLDL